MSKKPDKIKCIKCLSTNLKLLDIDVDFTEGERVEVVKCENCKTINKITYLVTNIQSM